MKGKRRHYIPKTAISAKWRNTFPGVAYALLLIPAVLYIFPLLIILTNSFMAPAEINRNYSDRHTRFDFGREAEIHYAEYNLIPETVSTDQYYQLLFESPAYLDMFVNSVRLTLPAVGMQMLVGALAAYGFTRWKFKYKEFFFCLYVIIMLLPFQATLVSNYIIAGRLGILNTRLSVILPMGFSPFAVFMMRQAMKGIPGSIFEAAQIDGASHFRRFFHIAVPLSKGGLASLAILTFSDGWGMVEQPLIFLRDAAMEPLSVFLSRMSRDGIGLIFAASVFYMLPAVWVFVYGQEYFEQGIRLSALR